MKHRSVGRVYWQIKIKKRKRKDDESDALGNGVSVGRRFEKKVDRRV